MDWTEQLSDAIEEAWTPLKVCESLLHLLKAQLAILQAEVQIDTLRAEINRLTPKWQDGEPPKTEPGKPVYVWREGCNEPVSVMYSNGDCYQSHGVYWLSPENYTVGRYEPWGTARWAPIPRPA